MVEVNVKNIKQISKNEANVKLKSGKKIKNWSGFPANRIILFRVIHDDLVEAKVLNDVKSQVIVVENASLLKDAFVSWSKSGDMFLFVKSRNLVTD